MSKKEGRIKKFYNDFKAFISKGNVIDLAVGVIIGTAFGKIVTSLVNDIITPFIVLASGKTSLADLNFVIRKAVVVDGVEVQPALTVNWGTFLQTVIDFLIISLVVYLFIRLLMKIKKEGEKLADKAFSLVATKSKEDKEVTAEEDKK